MKGEGGGRDDDVGDDNDDDDDAVDGDDVAGGDCPGVKTSCHQPAGMYSASPARTFSVLLALVACDKNRG